MYQYFGGPIIGWQGNYMPIQSWNETQGEPNHIYSLCSYGGSIKVNETYPTRHEAESAMYKLCNRNGLAIDKVYNDKHDKTYFTNKGTEFHINRLF